MALTKKQNANWWYYEWDASDFNLNKGITTGLDSSATVKPQPSGTMTAWDNKINGANPSSPSTNNATRRAEYNIDNWNTKIWDYETYVWWTFTPTHPTSAPQEATGKRELKSYYDDLGGKEALDEINAIFNEKWISTWTQYFREMYGDAQAEALEKAMQANVDLGKAITEKRWYLGHTSVNADRVTKIADEVYKAVAYNSVHWIKNDINEIARNTWATPEEVQAIMTGDAYRLIELTDEYKQREFRDYYRKGEDLSLEMEYNRNTFQNTKKYTDYQFESTMNKLERSLFDSERATRTQSAIYGMTGTRYALDRIRKQYEEQMNDVTQSYQYQSAQAQLNINYALQNYWNAMVRLDQDLDYATQEAQKLALQEMTNLNNAVGLSFQQQKSILLNLQKQIDQIKATWLQSTLEQWEKWNTELWNQIANAYGLTVPWTWTMRTERNNNPTAMTTDVAKSLGAVEWVDYVQGDKFPWDSKLYTARLLGDPVETTIRIFDNAAEKGIPIFYTKWWKQRWTYIAMTNDQWKALSDEQKKNVIYSMLQHEWWKMNAMSYYAQNWTTTATTEWWEQVATNYNKNYEKDYTTYLTKWTDWFKKSSQEALIKKFGSWDNFVANANAYKAVVDKQVTDVADVMLRDMIEIRDWLDKDWSMTWLRVPIPWTDSWKYKNMFNQVIKGEALQNLINLKSNWATFGALSNQELWFITDAANWFSIWDSEENFKTELNRKISKILNQYWLTESDFVSSERWTEMPSTQINNSPVNPTSQSTFNTPWYIYAWANYTWAQQSWTVNTWAAPVWQK